MYDYDYNAILYGAIKNKSDIDQIQATQALNKYLQYRRFHPKFHIMDNEYPRAVLKHICNNNNGFQISPLNIDYTKVDEW